MKKIITLWGKFLWFIHVISKQYSNYLNGNYKRNNSKDKEVEHEQEMFINNLSVFILNPDPDLKLSKGDILYWLGKVETPEIESKVQKIIIETL